MMNPSPIQQPAPQPDRLRLPIVPPIWTYVFLGIIGAVFLLLTVTGGSESSQNLIRFGANYAPSVAKGEYWRLLTANFLHIGILHLLVNGYALYALGREVEGLFGYQRFIAIYLLSGITGAIASFMLTQGLSAGASTSLFGLFGALAVFFYRQRKLLGNFGQQRLIGLGLTLAINVAIGLQPGSRIDNFGHLGGVIGGAILAWFLCPRYTLVGSYYNTSSPTYLGAQPMPVRGTIVDTNSLRLQSFSVGLFSLGLVALTVLAQILQRK
jgi:rhomboid protease GluP